MSLPNPVRVVQEYGRFLSELRAYRRASLERIALADLHPFIFDRTDVTPVDPYYFLQDTWAARKIISARPALHVDVGSTALLVGILAQFTRVCSVDVRPLDVPVPGLSALAADAVMLPFRSRSLKSVSSLCVLEHVGLGRYGDTLSPRGADLAMAELQRILGAGGSLYVSVPIDVRNRVCFNAHRVFTVDTVRAGFSALTLVETVFVQGKRANVGVDALSALDFDAGMVVGLFEFRR